MELPPLRHLHFHAPCFDGAASAAMLVHAFAGRGRIPKLHPVGYERRSSWLRQRLPKQSGVVDFLYHPSAVFWADHHESTFLDARDAERERDILAGSAFAFDPTADSCATIIWQGLRHLLVERAELFEVLAMWANKIDAALYDSAEEAMFGDAPALRISQSLVLDRRRKMSVRLARELATRPLEEVARLRFIDTPYREVSRLRHDGLERFAAGSQQDDGIVRFDISVEGVFFPRYAPFFMFPDADYSVGVIRSGNWRKVTAMRNPWKEFVSAPLGPKFVEIGGGGHHRIGSTIVPDDRDVREIAQEIVEYIGAFHQETTSSLGTTP